MFPRIITTNQNGIKYRYLVLVENYREGNRIKQRKVYSFGAITNPDTKTSVDSLLLKLRRYSSGNLFKPDELSTENSQLFGQPLVVKTLWDKLELTNAIKTFLQGKKVTFDVVIYLLILVLNHLIAPKSDLAVSRWYKQIYLKELEDKELDWYNFYRALDYLYAIKEKIENYLFNKLCDLFTLKVNIVFYDLTSTYFEGDGPEIANYGYSKDGKPGCHQILLALVVTEDGFPIAVEVYPGNYPETYTLADALENLSKRFKINRCILVCDRGLVSKTNLKNIKEHNFQYIIAMKSRDKQILKIIDPDLKTYKQLDENLFKCRRIPRSLLRG
ncbi:MAG: IS1634 family transposase [Elusimicrobiota bacterium]